MAKKNEPLVEVEAIMRFPYKGRALFPGNRFSVSPDEAAILKSEKFVKEAKGKYLRRDMNAQDT